MSNKRERSDPREMLAEVLAELPWPVRRQMVRTTGEDGSAVLERQIGACRWSLDIDPDGTLPFVIEVDAVGSRAYEVGSTARAAKSLMTWMEVH